MSELEHKLNELLAQETRKKPILAILGDTKDARQLADYLKEKEQYKDREIITVSSKDLNLSFKLKRTDLVELDSVAAVSDLIQKLKKYHKIYEN